MEHEITIRPAESVADYRACQEAQRKAWGISEDGYVVPVATLVGAQLHGGLVLGAFLPDGTAVGLSFAFLGRVEGRLSLYSQLTGVVPGFQGRGIGLRLKTEQWTYARDQGLELLAWAFDPLQAGNAHFNLEKLGATVGRYVENMYGPRTDALNAGVPTDRLIAEWTTTPRSRSPLDPESIPTLPRLVSAVFRADGLPDVVLAPLDPASRRLLVEIPEEIPRLRSTDPALAREWGQAIRRALTEAFAAGYRAVGFHRTSARKQRRCYYVLQGS